MAQNTFKSIGIIFLMVIVSVVLLTIHHPETPTKASDFTSTVHKAPLSFSKNIHIMKSHFSKVAEYVFALIILISPTAFNSILYKRLMHIPLQIRGRFLMPIKLTSTSF